MSNFFPGAFVLYLSCPGDVGQEKIAQPCMWTNIQVRRNIMPDKNDDEKMTQSEAGRKGGEAAHEKGTAHEFSSEEAREAGRKGGEAAHRE
jgi:general stress protein YciG